uniref:Uncharacterized protein n=1 Tax=Arundo donax TaxID=35708 RepID=A0A0A9CW71_ARUDO
MMVKHCHWIHKYSVASYQHFSVGRIHLQV